MCGIGFVIANITTYKQIEVVEQLMHCSAVRGFHSTGVFTKNGWVKDSVQPYNLIEENANYKSLSNEYVKTPNSEGNFMVFHNRHATIGAINALNSHPFEHGNITMVHNGTVRTRSLLPEHRMFEVDSDNICYSLDVWGVEKTIANLHAAFALIWFDSTDNTLHLIRNSERPFFLQRVADKQWYGASEEGMLKWILKRNKVSFTESEGFELETFVEYVFDETGDLIMRRKRKGYVAPANSSYYGSRYPSSSTPPATPATPANPAVPKTNSLIPSTVVGDVIELDAVLEGEKTKEKKSKKNGGKKKTKGTDIIPWGSKEEQEEDQPFGTDSTGTKTGIPTKTSASSKKKTSTDGTTDSRRLASSEKSVVRYSYNTNDNLTAAGHDLKGGDELEFVLTKLTDTAGYVKLDGYAANDILEDVLCFGVPTSIASSMETYKVYKAPIVNAYFASGDLRIVVDGNYITFVRDDEEEEDDDTFVDTFWQNCEWCNDPISESERADVEKECEGWGYFVCPQCLDSLNIP